MNLITPLTKGERTRAHIVATAASLFWRYNFHGVSVDRIADVAGVNKATVYRYFADKNDIALAAVRYHGELTLRDVFEANFKRFARPEERLAGIYSDIHCAHQALKDEDGDLYGCPVVGLALELGQEMPALRAEARAIFDRVEGFLHEIAKGALAASGKSGSAEGLARTLVQLLHGAFASARLSAEPDRIIDAGNASLELIGYPNTPILLAQQAA
ncbi:TetR/AcrR family transcriptional regulator [uncultured Erythrobacter sp.]|uniref:TetR/AcrR family transcriptional regulator n=1 Tax=uncultured Erythrobacter sp. TaxID=263913 RepID=UPI002639A494|nr:TetR/AcrR family transcriptional regulator [uncultured Erythrobacter sp.]